MATFNQNPSIRLLSEMKEVVYDKDWLEKADPNLELYYVWRGVAETDKEKRKITKAGLRYDITEFAPLTLGVEFNKTFGHEHSLVPGTNTAYPEIYEVLEGEVYFLFQKLTGNKIEDIYIVHCQAGDKYIVPPGYAHITINPTKQKTVMANWLALASKQSYDNINRLHGGGYYGIKNNTGIKWIKNQSYESVPDLKSRQPNNLGQLNINLTKQQKIYHLVNDLEKLDFLKNPQNYKWE